MASFAGSILDNGTKATPGVPYYSGGGGGGGGSGTNVSSVTSVTSSLTVSTILGGGPAQTLTFPNGFSLPAGASIELGGAPGPTAVGDIDFTNNNGTITGVSTINGNPYPPSGGAVSTLMTSRYAPGGGLGPVTLASTPTVAGKWYNIAFNLTDITAPVGIAPGDHVGILADTTVLGYFDLVQVSTCKALGQPIGYSVNGPAVAAGANMIIGAQTNAACAVSSFLTCDFAGWVTKLN